MKRLLILALLRGLSLLPWGIIQSIGWVAGVLLAWIPNRQRRDALINIRLCLPQLSTAEQWSLRRRSMIHFARTFVELSALWLWPTQRVLNLIRHETGMELLKQEPGRGIIFLTPHLGAWELTSLYIGAKSSVTCMYRPQRHLNAFILAARQRCGSTLVPDDVGGVKHMLRTVLSGGQIGILPDQVTREESGSVFAPFFGVPAVTMLLVAGLARRSKARVLFIFAERLPGSAGFNIHCLPAPPGIDSLDDQVAAAALNQGVEQCIRFFPDQYHWTYRRFRRRPNQEPNPYVGSYI